jgi:Peptidase M76 family
LEQNLFLILSDFLALQACVRRRAIDSVTANAACPNEAAAERAVNEVWESCFNDTRPFDEVRTESVSCHANFRKLKYHVRSIDDKGDEWTSFQFERFMVVLSTESEMAGRMLYW